MKRVSLAVLVVGILILHASTKDTVHLPEMLWACHIASMLIALGIAMNWRRVICAGLLFHLSIGLPSYVLDITSTLTVAPTSLLVHIVPPVAAWWALRPSAWIAMATTWKSIGAVWIAHALLIVFSYLTTDPALNINLAHAPWPPLQNWFPQLWMLWIFHFFSSLACLTVMAWLLRQCFVRVDSAPVALHG